MKKTHQSNFLKNLPLIFCLLLLLSINTLKAQKYIHFPDSIGVWRETYIRTIPPPFPFMFDATGDTYYHGDTIIGNLFYHKIFQKALDIFCSHNVLGTYYIGALREDTVQQKVYVIKDGQNEEQVLYDFSLHSGDMFPNSDNIKVFFVDTILTDDGIARRRWNIEGSMSSYVIEGIGGTNGMFSNELAVEYPDQTICFEGDNKQKVAINYSYCYVETDTCYFLSTIDYLSEKDIAIYPNPMKINSQASIVLPNKLINNLVNIEVANLYGQKYDIINIKDGVIILNAPPSSGIYIISLKMKNNYTLIKKIIVIN